MPARCSACGTEFPSSRLACPSCHTLLHADELGRLAEKAERATLEGRAAEALAVWRQALELLPPESMQSRQVGARISALVSAGEPKATSMPAIAGAGEADKGKRKGLLSTLAAGAALVLTKFKFVLILILTKLKWLALGLSKGATLLTMLLSIGVYWAAWGWPFALGFVVSIYIHEMGHVAALDRLGIKASAPMFVPGFGAFVRMKQYPVSPSEDAYVGLAGPIWGTGAALGSFILWRATGYGLWGGLAEWGARINLFNLMPIASLDGSRGLRALSTRARWVLIAVTVGAWMLTQEGMLLLVSMVMVFRAFGEAPPQSDRRATVTFVALILGLALLAAAPKWLGLDPRV